MVMNLPVKSAMSSNPVSVGPSVPIDVCAKKMLKEGVGTLIVEENGYLKGLLTEKDLVSKVMLAGLDPKKLVVKDVMTCDVHVIAAENRLNDAIKRMNDHSVRKLPVLNRVGKVVGMLTVNDVLAVQPALLDHFEENIRVGKHSIFDDGGRQGDCIVCGEREWLREDELGRWVCSNCEGN